MNSLPITSSFGVTGGFSPREAAHPFTGHGLVSFSKLLDSARVAGPVLDLGPDDAPGTNLNPAALAGGASTFGVSHAAASTLPARAQEWLGPIEDAARRHGVDPRLLTALVWTESAFRVDAVSPAGAIGLGQLMPGTAAGMGVDPHDPIQNIEGAATYISQQLRSFGEIDLALAAYNAGPGRVVKSGGVPNIAETQAYVRIVSDRYESLVRGGE